MIIKKVYYFIYYTIYKLWNRDYNPLLSNDFKTDISIIALKIWFLGVIDTYISILLNHDTTDISIVSPKVIISLVIAIISTLYFFTFSDKWKLYFREFEQWPKRKNQIGRILVWCIIVFIFINMIISVEIAKRLS